MSDKKDPKVEKAFKELSDKFPARYKVRATKYLKALLWALAEGDGYIDSQVDAVADNTMVVTASGKYLDRLGSLYGASRGRATGVQDSDFQKIVPVIGSNPKQIISTLQKLIDYIYGPYASHANTTCASPAPYNLSNGAKLRIRVDDKEVDIYFKSSDARTIEKATAQEVATAISDRSKGRVVGSVVTNVRTGEQFVNIRTATIGTQGFIQVLGGEAQSSLRFPEIRPSRNGIGTYSVERHKGTDEMKYSFVSGLSPACRTAGIRIGDLVTISTASGFHEKNCGTFKVSFIEEDSFRVINPNGVPEENITHLNEDDFVFYRPDLGNILLAARPATIIHTSQRELTVILPVTSPIVKRTLRGSHHFHSGVSSVTSATEETLTLSSPAGFTLSKSLLVVGNREMAEGSVSSVSGSSIVMINGEGWPESGSVYSPTERRFYFYKTKSGNQLNQVWPTPSSTLAGTVLKYVKKFSYEGISGNTLTGVKPSPMGIVGQDVVSEVVLEENFPGSFLYDLNSPYSISNQSTYIEEKIQQGSSRTVIKVKDIKDWGNEGYFMIAYGTKEEEGPIKYLNKVGQEALIIDPGHVFDRDHLKGVSIRRVRHLGPTIPRVNGQDLPVFLTGTSQARTLLAEYLRALVAAGVVLKFKIIIPEQKWTVLPLLYSTNPLEDDLAIKQPEDERVGGGNNLPPSAPPPLSVPLVFNPVVVPAPPEPETPSDGGGEDPDGGGSGSSNTWVTPTFASNSSIPKRFDTNGWAYRASLSWDAIPGATSYKLWKNGNGFTPNTIIEVPSNSYVDYQVFVNNQVSYKVQAIKGSQSGGYEATPLSEEIIVFIDPGIELETTTVPNLAVTYNPSANRAYLSHQTPEVAINPFSQMVYYRGEVIDGVKQPATQISVNTDSMGKYDQNITVGKTYYWYYVHKIQSHTSQPSNQIQMEVGGENITLQASANSATFNSPTMYFTCNTINQGSTYELWFGAAANSLSKHGSMTSVGNQMTYNVNSGLTAGTTYYSKVVVKNINNVVIKESSVVNANTHSRPANASGIVVGAYDSSDGGVSVNWTVPTGSLSWVDTSTSPSPSISNGSQSYYTGTRVSDQYGSTRYVHVWAYKDGLLSNSPVSSSAIKLITPAATLKEVSHTLTTLNISTFSPNAASQGNLTQGPVHGATSMTLKVYKAQDNSLIKTLSVQANLNDYQITGLPSGEPVLIEFIATNGQSTFTSQKIYFSLNV